MKLDYRFEARLTDTVAIGPVDGGVRADNYFDGVVTEGELAGARVRGIDQIRIREDASVVLEGEVEAVVGDARARLRAGGLAVVPAMVPHGAVNVGPSTARVAGVFSSNTIVAIFDHAFDQTGGRVVGSPPPAAAIPTPA